jgi:hypothetical protein
MTGGGRSVGIVRSRTKATEFSFSLDIGHHGTVGNNAASFSVRPRIPPLPQMDNPICRRVQTSKQYTAIGHDRFLSNISTQLLIKHPTTYNESNATGTES